MAFFAFKGKAGLQNHPGFTKIMTWFEPFTDTFETGSARAAL